MLIDTHAHLDEQSFDTDREDVLARAAEAGVQSILSIGVTLSTSRAAVELARRYGPIQAVVGIQPNYVAEAQADDFDAIIELSRESCVVGIGETGLDKYWDAAPLDLQQEYFHKHIELSIECGKPFVVHCREAEPEVVELLRSHANTGPLNGVMHSFCGDQATAEACLDMGMHISFAGMLTYKRNSDLREVASRIPLERLLVETDCPYLAPVPVRGKRNEPANVVHTARCLAELHSLSLDELAEQTTANARRLFDLATD